MPKKIFYQLDVTLLECPFEVTRSLIVPADIRLDFLHGAIQHAMGWHDSHMHEFQSKSKRYGMKMMLEEEGDDLCDERRVRLSAIVKPRHPEFSYIYDYGDNWVHRVQVSNFDCKDIPPKRLISCIAGTGACPPEDCGGTTGYEEFCDAFNNPENPEHDEQVDWVYNSSTYPRSQKWPDGFNLKFTDMLLNSFERWYRRETAPKTAKPRKVWVYTGK